MRPERPNPGQESVWDYPRPPKLELSTRNVRVLFAGRAIAQSSAAYRILETSHPPSWYIPPANIDFQFLLASNKTSFCEWKGSATYWSVQVETEKVDAERFDNAAWSYESPNPRFAAIKGYLAFYPHIFECYVDNERVLPQPGGFYGGWITSDVVGPFKGIPGSWGW